MGFTFDTGMLIALDRYDRDLWNDLLTFVEEGFRPTVPAPVITQAWRSPRQVNLARALQHCVIDATDEAMARHAGELLATSGAEDAVDAIVVASAARRGDVVWTSDPDDITALASATANVAVFAV